jgi:hypothetical protein
VEQENDDADPFRTDAKAYRFAWQDDQIERHVLPMKERIEARGERIMEAMAGTPGALEHFAQITYHLYHGGAEDVPARNAVRGWARKLKVTAAQTEWMEGTGLDVARHIHLCLTEADATAWDRFGADLFFTLKYREWLDPASDGTQPALNSTAWHIRQFSRYIRPGAVRVALSGGSESVKGVAFLPKLSSDGRSRPGLPVVVLLNTSSEARAVEIDGLPPGTYGGSFTSEPQKAYGRGIEDMAVAEPGRLAIDLPPRSVTTLTSSDA